MNFKKIADTSFKCHSFTAAFQAFYYKNQLPGLSVSGTLIENRLTIRV